MTVIHRDAEVHAVRRTVQRFDNDRGDKFQNKGETGELLI